MTKSMSTAKGTFLFGSTIIGAGILALPVAASHTGFIPLAAMILLVGGVSSLSGLYIAEAVLAEEKDVHLPTLAKIHLGAWGELAMLLGITIYVYGALIGYLAAGGQVFYELSGGAIPVWVGTIFYFVIGSLILHRGITLVSRINAYLMYAMLVLLGILIALAAPSIKMPFLVRSNWTYILDVFGVVLFAYLGHSVIPSIALSLENKRRIAVVVLVGVALPCVLYLLWSVVVLGAVPATSEHGSSLAEALAAGQPATIPLGEILGGSVIILGNVFAAVSMLTSYIGFGVSLKDSYSDLSRQKRREVSEVALTAFVVIPPLLVALLIPGAFVSTLEISGAFGGGLFVGILPVLIIIKLRQNGAPRPFTTWGGKTLPWLVLSVYVFGILYTVAGLMGMVP